jgi:hypothetical protein
VLARSHAEARLLVGHLSAGQRKRLRTFALCLGRAQQQTRVTLPPDLTGRLVAVAGSLLSLMGMRKPAALLPADIINRLLPLKRHYVHSSRDSCGSHLHGNLLACLSGCEPNASQWRLYMWLRGS